MKSTVSVSPSLGFQGCSLHVNSDLVILPEKICSNRHWKFFYSLNLMFSAQSSLSIFTQKYLYKCEDTYFILENKYLCIYVDSFGAKIFREVKKTFKLYAQAQISLFHSEIMKTIRHIPISKSYSSSWLSTYVFQKI